MEHITASLEDLEREQVVQTNYNKYAVTCNLQQQTGVLLKTSEERCPGGRPKMGR